MTTPSEPRREASIGLDAGAARRPLSWLWRTALSNLPFVLALAAMGRLPDFLQVLVVGAVIFLAPGLAWSDRRAGDAFVVLFRAIVAALIIGLLGWLSLAALPGPTSRVGFILFLAAATNIGLWFGFRRRWYDADPFGTPLSRLLMIVSAAFFLQSFAGAAYFIPALEDQDMETQGTAYGLINTLEPTMVTNRGTRHFFAHPLLLHFWIGEGALVSDDLGKLKYHHDGSIAVRDATTDQKIPTLLANWEKNFAQFQREPLLLPTRTPNLFLSAFVIFPIGFLTYRLSGSKGAALGACLVYATLPEVYVRTAYGGYLAITNFLLVSGAYFYMRAAGLLPDPEGREVALPRSRRLTFGAALMGGMSDQKAILGSLAGPAHAGIRLLIDGGWKGVFKAPRSTLARPDVLAALLIGSGFVIGEVLFIIYGLGADAPSFIEDHIKGHIVRRMKLDAVDLNAGTTWYPSIVALWRQFGDHSGWLFIAASVLGMWRAARRIAQGEGMLLLWILIGAVGFSLTDWRQTKHLAHLLPAMSILIGLYWAAVQGWTRRLLTAALAVAVAWNIWRIGLLMNDFTYLKPLPIW